MWFGEGCGDGGQVMDLQKTGGVAEMKDNDVKGGRRVVWSPQERQAEFMQRGEYEALYGGAPAEVSLTHFWRRRSGRRIRLATGG